MPDLTTEDAGLAATMLHDVDFAKRCRQYGITPNEGIALYFRQGQRCVICERPAHYRDLVIDHSHRTGQVRGLLCPACNQALGLFGDSVPVVRRAVRYLRDESMTVEERSNIGDMTGPVPRGNRRKGNWTVDQLRGFVAVGASATHRREAHSSALNLGEACPACVAGVCSPVNVPLLEPFNPRRRSAVTRGRASSS